MDPAGDPVPFRRDNAQVDPPYLVPEFKSTLLRAPGRPLVSLQHTLSEVTGPVFGHRSVLPHESDLTSQSGGRPIGQRIILYGRVVDGDGRPVPGTLVELWQANSAGRYIHKWDRYDAPVDPNFSGVGRALTDHRGGYRFLTIKPGPYPFGNHHNAWRPSHIHLSVFGPAFVTRLVTQMYFPGDPLLGQDPVFNSVPGREDRRRLICEFDLDATLPDDANAYRFDIVLRGRDSTPFSA
ncbi:MAG TPA: protocatechuate 3,4-dioxygenase subunit beta [Acidimicrobiia bacterium]|nr:protocatechuate 3,4-dioxygenase subunit beta [Acidimicrobiia bacterium]